MPSIAKQSPRTPTVKHKKNGVLGRIVPVGSLKKGIKLLAYGRGKTGKTRLFSTFPKPALLIGTEDGTNSIADVKGVDVFVLIQDPNGDYYSETVTADSTGSFMMSWAPSIVGEYQVTVIFEGSNSYYTSYATTGFVVDATPAAPGYQGPSADEIAANTAQRTIAMLPSYPDVPTQEQIAADAAQRTIAMMPQYPEYPGPQEIPEYQTIDLILIVLVVVGLIIGIYIVIKKK